MKAYTDNINVNDAVTVDTVTVGSCGGGECHDTQAREPAAASAQLQAKRTPRQEVHDIIREVAEAAGTGVTVEQVMGKSREWHIVAVRHTATVAVAERFPWMSYPQLARILGDRDHSSIMHVLRKMGALRPRKKGGGGGANSVKARSYGHLMDILFVRIGAALSVPTTTKEGGTTNGQVE